MLMPLFQENSLISNSFHGIPWPPECCSFTHSFLRMGKSPFHTFLFEPHEPQKPRPGLEADRGLLLNLCLSEWFPYFHGSFYSSATVHLTIHGPSNVEIVALWRARTLTPPTFPGRNRFCRVWGIRTEEHKPTRSSSPYFALNFRDMVWSLPFGQLPRRLRFNYRHLNCYSVRVDSLLH